MADTRLYRLAWCTDAVRGWTPDDVLAEVVRGIDEFTFSEVRTASSRKATAYVWAFRLAFTATSASEARRIAGDALAGLTPAYDAVRLTTARGVALAPLMTDDAIDAHIAAGRPSPRPNGATR